MKNKKSIIQSIVIQPKIAQVLALPPLQQKCVQSEPANKNVDTVSTESLANTETNAVSREMEIGPEQISDVVATDLNEKAIIQDELCYLQGNGQHAVLAEASVGLQHRNHKPYPLPCQDAVNVTLHPRPILILCDGAGSASISEIGSSTLTIQLTRLCQSMEPLLAHYLDHAVSDGDIQTLARIIIRHAMGVLQDLSTIHRREIKDFRSTLNFAIVGKSRILWMKVGDGEIVQEKISYYASQPEKYSHQLSCIGEQAKGEFANQTQFIDSQLTFADVQWGTLETQTTLGLALMSDGASEKLVSHRRDQVSGQVSLWLDLLRQDKLKASDLCKRFYSEEFNVRSTGDDRSIAMWTQNVQQIAEIKNKV